jgi:Coenzyme PQQ synthesis protein D (PqqD)
MGALRLRPERLEWRRVDDEVVAVDLRSSVYLAANESAAPLWEALAEGTTRDDLVDRLAWAAGIDRERAAADVDDFLCALADRQLLDETASA